MHADRYRRHALHVGCNIPLQRVASGKDGDEVSGADKKLVVVFEEKRPVRGVKHRLGAFRFDGIVTIDLGGCDLSAREFAAGRHRRREFFKDGLEIQTETTVTTTTL